MARIGFSADTLGNRREVAIVFGNPPDREGFLVEHVGAHIRDIAGSMARTGELPTEHPLKTFVEYVAMVGDPVLVLGESQDTEGRTQAQNVLLLPVVADVRTVGWIVAIREVA